MYKNLLSKESQDFLLLELLTNLETFIGLITGHSLIVELIFWKYSKDFLCIQKHMRFQSQMGQTKVVFDNQGKNTMQIHYISIKKFQLKLKIHAS